MWHAPRAIPAPRGKSPGRCTMPRAAFRGIVCWALVDTFACRARPGLEQRLRLQAEGVAFRGSRVDMARHAFDFKAKRKGKPS